MNVNKSVAVIGAGASGLMAACIAAKAGATVTVFEKNKSIGRKLAITGKGRCNLTNNCDINEFLTNIPTNPRFLYAAVNNMPPSSVMEFFEGLGVQLKTERGNRVFPVSDRAYDVVDALRRELSRTGCRIIHSAVDDILTENSHVCGVSAGEEKYAFERVILATGGASYPLTGSTGDGYKFAQKLGIEVTEIRPSLVPLVIKENFCREMQGLSLKNTGLKLIDTLYGKVLHEDFGEMLFTHFGVSGPMILSASAHIPVPERFRYILTLDLKPALDEQELDKRILSDFIKYKNRDYANSLDDLLPQKMIPVIVNLSGISPDKKVNSITKDERRRLISLLKGFNLTVTGARPISEAIITSGGISVSEINPKTMESKKIPGLYFAGEVIDVDAYTGGFNLQIAFCTAALAAKNASL